MAPTESNKRLALAIIDFLGSSLKDGTLTADDTESIEIAQSCIADTFKVDPTDEAAVKEAVGGQSLANIYSVYEKLRNKSTPQASSSNAQESQDDKPKAGAPTAESDRLKSEGNALMSRKDYPGAIEQYSKALEIAPGNPIYLSNRAAAYSASNQHEKAVEDAELAVAVDAKYSKAWSRLGLARFDMGDYHAAKEAYEKGIEAEGNGGSEAMKRGLETCQRKIEETSRGAEPPSEELDSAAGASRGAGGMPDLSSLASMFGGGGAGGGGGMPDMSSIMSNPMFASMAQNLMSNPDMLGNLMNNPRLRQMAEGFGQGGGMPDMSSLMSDPSLAEMARNMMGGGAGRGAGAGNQ
ncbi:Small glutamine-rich tetratricopeptide repeat-containing protein 2 [Penicillium longicatenatum]|uniref:Small glutamine-rich tetratricopeptide repeat-containing protein 2 n=1 Tax=Penicillium longicatenatum TaxID=1561947 RepID=UPI0025488318|nr:Small glutamine-rich tetratricopeptide repeat-containing protein 2 [Penicillium longicatenatum]KAJ5630761.1 Small glutamine-rich tetratricopeptide repeat-containing protein 2 [Penicillium longicatenatum]